MSREILLVADAVSNERGVAREVVFEAIESALASAAKKRYQTEVDVRVSIDRRTGAYHTVRRWLIVDDEQELDNPDAQLHLTAALERLPNLQVGQYYEETLENDNFGRIAAQTAKQVIFQKIREAERAQVVNAYLHRKGELISGLVKRAERGNLIIDLGGNVEALLARDEMIPREMLRNGDRVRAYIKDVRHEPRGPQIFLSRTAPELLMRLFELEVPEIGQGLIEIKGAARDPGVRAKIAVKAKDTRIDAVGSCVGMRGSRVQSVSNELSSERVDIVLWDDNPAQFVINAMSPAEVVSIVQDDDQYAMDIAVAEEKLSQAIGRNGQNVRLASQLTGWTLNVMTESQARAKNGQEEAVLRQMFIDTLGVDEEVAAILVREGFSSLEEVAYVPAQEMLEIEEFDEEIVETLRNQARAVLVEQALVQEEHVEEAEPSAELLAMEGMDRELAYTLAGHNITSLDDLAELAVDDLTALAGIGEERAAQLIMTARAPWFSGEQG